MAKKKRADAALKSSAASMALKGLARTVKRADFIPDVQTYPDIEFKNKDGKGLAVLTFDTISAASKLAIAALSSSEISDTLEVQMGGKMDGREFMPDNTVVIKAATGDLTPQMLKDVLGIDTEAKRER